MFLFQVSLLPDGNNRTQANVQAGRFCGGVLRREFQGAQRKNQLKIIYILLNTGLQEKIEAANKALDGQVKTVDAETLRQWVRELANDPITRLYHRLGLHKLAAKRNAALWSFFNRLSDYEKLQHVLTHQCVKIIDTSNFREILPFIKEQFPNAAPEKREELVQRINSMLHERGISGECSFEGSLLVFTPGPEVGTSAIAQPHAAPVAFQNIAMPAQHFSEVHSANQETRSSFQNSSDSVSLETVARVREEMARKMQEERAKTAQPQRMEMEIRMPASMANQQAEKTTEYQLAQAFEPQSSQFIPEERNETQSIPEKNDCQKPPVTDRCGGNRRFPTDLREAQAELAVFDSSDSTNADHRSQTGGITQFESQLAELYLKFSTPKHQKEKPPEDKKPPGASGRTGIRSEGKGIRAGLQKKGQGQAKHEAPSQKREQARHAFARLKNEAPALLQGKQRQEKKKAEKQTPPERGFKSRAILEGREIMPEKAQGAEKGKKRQKEGKKTPQAEAEAKGSEGKRRTKHSERAEKGTKEKKALQDESAQKTKAMKGKKAGKEKEEEREERHEEKTAKKEEKQKWKGQKKQKEEEKKERQGKKEGKGRAKGEEATKAEKGKVEKKQTKDGKTEIAGKSKEETPKRRRQAEVSEKEGKKEKQKEEKTQRKTGRKQPEYGSIHAKKQKNAKGKKAQNKKKGKGKKEGNRKKAEERGKRKGSRKKAQGRSFHSPF